MVLIVTAKLVQNQCVEIEARIKISGYGEMVTAFASKANE